MAWSEMTETAAYTSPGGRRVEFYYEPSFEKSTSLKTAENTFPDMDGAEVRDLGLGGRKFPMTALFYGEGCMDDADAFEDALCERGAGILEHPVYGKRNVVATGEISRSDDLVGAANESRVKVTFAETISDKGGPDSDVAATDRLEAEMDAFEEACADEFGGLIEAESPEDKVQLTMELRTQSGLVFSGTESLIEQCEDADAKRSFLEKLRGMKKNVDKWLSEADRLAKNAQLIAVTLIKVSRMPSQMLMSALRKIEGYSAMMKSLLDNAKSDPLKVNALKNQFAVTSMALGALAASCAFGVAMGADAARSGTASGGKGKQAGSGGAGGNPTARSAAEKKGGAGGGSKGKQKKANPTGARDLSGGESGAGAISSSAGGFKSRDEVTSASAAVAALMETYTRYIDRQSAKNVFVETGGGYEALYRTVRAAIRVIQEASLSFPLVRTRRLERDRQLIEFLCEVYGADGLCSMDQFINDNRLTADELVIMPMGREVRYYG